nr:hypothetical protein [Tanacetum cinerariifolium]
MHSLGEVKKLFKFLTENLKDFGIMPIFKRTFSHDLDLLEPHLSNDILSQTDCKTTLKNLRTQFENAFNSDFEECIHRYTRYNAQSFKDAMIRHKFSPNKTSAVYEKISPRSNLRWKPTGIIFKFVGLRWLPTGKLFDSCTSKVESEPTHGSNVDISKIHEYKQTLDLSAGTSINVLKEQSLDTMASDHLSSDPVPECQKMASDQNSSDPAPESLLVERFQYLVRRLGMRCLTPAELEALANEPA